MSGSADSLVLGVDGGGSKTVFWLVEETAEIGGRPFAEAVAGPTNPRTAGIEPAVAQLEAGVRNVLRAAGLAPGRPLAAACLALAGSDRKADRRPIQQWAEQFELAVHVAVVHDAAAVLAAASAENLGVALLSGTGSLAFGKCRQGNSARAGGWGPLCGDEGSGYALARLGLQAVAKGADGRGPATALTSALCSQLGIDDTGRLVEAVYCSEMDRKAIAGLGQAVILTAERGDPVAEGLVQQAAAELAEMALAVARQLDLPSRDYPLALAGSLILNSPLLQQQLTRLLDDSDRPPRHLVRVAEPVFSERPWLMKVMENEFQPGSVSPSRKVFVSPSEASLNL